MQKKKPPKSRPGRRQGRGVTFFFIFALIFIATGMIGGGQFRKTALKAEIRLKYYNEAIGHYEKAEAFFRAGEADKALQWVDRALKVTREFPEAYKLKSKIYLMRGDQNKARENEQLFQRYGGEKASLYRLRERLIEEIKQRQKHAPPPDIEPLTAYLISGGAVFFCLLGMIYDYWRLGGHSALPRESLILERFSSDEEVEVEVSWIFKACVLVLPAPFFFSFLVFSGFRHYSNLLPLFFFSWAVTAAALYLIFFADLRGLGEGLRRGRGGA